MKIRFEWDPAKATSNLRKHGVSFDTAIRAFADPFALTETALRVASNAGKPWVRWKGTVLLLVARTIREQDEDGQPIEIIRIVSARAADRKERRRYEEETR